MPIPSVMSLALNRVPPDHCWNDILSTVGNVVGIVVGWEVGCTEGFPVGTEEGQGLVKGQEDEPSSLPVPSAQTLHRVDPLLSVNVSTAHCSHDLAPVMLPNFPFSQGRHDKEVCP